MKERLDEIAKETGQLFFENGRLSYQIEQCSQEIESNRIKLRNLSLAAQKLKAKLPIPETTNELP